jgi:hypothetical protein
MKFTATIVHWNGPLDEQVGQDRYDREVDALEGLSNSEVEALSSVLGAGEGGELVSKLYRRAAASLQPDTLVIPLLAGDPGALFAFTFELASYRLFMDRLLAGNESPRELADAVEREQRAWLRRLIARFRHPADLLPDTGEDAQ